ncbi:MAG: hypothetical protein HYV26_03670 [Candidatus Hydrogenedentes bacterium]|nr:hypothetical protein [Candidatus Hydrogenedentota bacterium]
MTAQRVVWIALAVGLLAGVAGALEPEYTGQFGYAEEPALRPYKWFWVGVKSFGYQTKMGFVRGNMNFPVVGSIETVRGIRKGAIDLGENTWNGILYRSVPPKGYHKIQGDANNYIESDMLLRNASDFIASALVLRWYYWPVQKLVDYAPLESDEKVQIRLEQAEEVRQARRKAEAIRQEQRKLEDETPVEEAQRAYLDNPALYGSAKDEDKVKARQREEKYTGNLLKLKSVRRNHRY